MASGFESQGFDVTGTRDFTSPFYTPAAPAADVDDAAINGIPAASGSGSGSSASSSSSSSSSTAASSNAYDFYSEMFPSLPLSSAPKLQAANYSAATKPREVNERFQIIPQQLRPSGLGEKSHTEICKNVMAETGTQIEFSFAKNGILTILVSGKPDRVTAAKKKLLAALSKQYEVKIEIPKEHLSSFIGKGGSKLKSLQERTGARITVPKADSEQDYVTITGEMNAVELARKEVLEFVNERTNFLKENVAIEPMYHPFVCGFGNENMKQIAADTGAKIYVPPSDSEETDVVVSGPREVVSEALKRIQAIYSEKKRTTKSISVGVNKKQHRFIIGQKGANISEILKQTGCNVTVPPQDDPSDTITVSGDDSKLLQALQLVLEKANSVCLEEVPFEGAHLQRYVKVKGRNEMKDLEKGTKVIINVGPVSVDIQGPKEEVEAVRIRMIDLLASYKKLKFDEMDIPMELRKFVIGKNGQTLKKLKSDYGVDVFVPHEEEPVQMVLLAGEKDKVKVAKELLTKLVKEMASLAVHEIKVDPKFYKTVVGKKGETIKKLNEEFETCSIKVPSSAENSDIITIRGPKPDLDKLKEKIVKLVEDTRHYEIMHGFTEEVMIDKRAIKYVVGKNGNFINRIREINDVKIEINPEEPAATTPSTPNAPAKQQAEKKGKEGEKQQPAAAAAKGKEAKGKEGEKGKAKEGEKQQPAAAAVKGKEVEKGKGEKQQKEQPAAAPTANANEKGKGKEAEKEKGKGKDGDKDTAGFERIVIQGTKEGVEKAKKELLEKAKEMTEGGGMVTVELNIEQKYHKYLIGKERKYVKSLMDRYDVNVRFPRMDAPSDIVVIHGMKKNAEKAQAELLELLEYEKSMNHTQTLTADNAVLQQVMGVHPHSKLRLIQISETTNTHIDFEEGNKQGNKIVIRGPEKQVAESKALIEKYISEIHDTVNSEMKVDQKYFKVLIGLKGATVREISQKHNVDIKFPEDKSHNVKISGSKKDVEAAKQNILVIIKETDEKEASQAVKTLELDHKYHPGLRDFVRNHPEQFFAKVLFPKEGDPPNSILIRGKEADIDSAIQLLKENIEEAVTVQVEKVHHRGIIIHPKYKEIQEKFNVYIRIPSKETNSTNVVIRGKQNDIVEAEKAFRILVEEVIQHHETNQAKEGEKEGEGAEIFTEKLKAKQEYLGQIIGRAGSNIRKIQEDFRVKVDVKKTEGLIIISGASNTDVLDAKAKLQETIAQAENKKDLVVKVDPKYHMRLCGQRFANLQKIQEDFNVNIKVPKNGSDNIVVIGSPEDAKAAADYILQVIKEIEFEFKNTPREESKPKQNGSSSSSSSSYTNNYNNFNSNPPAKKASQGVPANDPFFAPPPQSISVDKTSVWGSKLN